MDTISIITLINISSDYQFQIWLNTAFVLALPYFDKIGIISQ